MGFNYSVDGFADTTYPDLTLVRGQLYYFNLTNVTSSHPLALRLSSGSTSAVPGTTGNNPSSGAFGNGSVPTTVIYQVPFDAPSTIVYQCVVHSNMIGTINIVDQTGYTGSAGTTGYTGSASEISGPQGPLGYTGSQGEFGYTGSAGVDGYVGSQGDAGGYTGSIGPRGFTGFTGSQGASLSVENSTPQPNSTGVAGQLAWDDNFLYVCVATNSWVRIGTVDQNITNW